MSTSLALLAAHFDEPLGQARRLHKPRAIIYMGSALAITLAVWVTVAPVDRVVHTQGRVVPSGKQQLVQHLEGGIVQQLFVHEGDSVVKGQNLIAVSALQANSMLGEKRARMDGLAARMARLQAEADGAGRYAPPPGVSGLDVQQQSEAFDARQAHWQQSQRVVEEQLVQKRQEVTETQARVKGLSSELDVARQQLNLVAGLVAKSAGSQLELLDAKAKVERLTTQIREGEQTIPRLLSAAVELQAKLGELRAQFRSDSRTALADARVEFQRLKQEMNADDDRVNRTVVKAPTSGKVNKVLANTVGGVVRAGDTLMEITPSDENLVVESKVSPAERGALQVGQKTVVKVAAFDYTTYGTLEGKISEISPDSLLDERGERYFRLAVEVDPQSAARFGQTITPGMTVSADAVTGQRTVLQFLLSPIRGLAATAFRDRK